MSTLFPLNKMKLLISLLILLIVVGVSCRKADHEKLIEQTEDYSNLKEKFFDTSNTSDEIKLLASDLKKQESIFKFLPEFAKKNGIPRWDKVFYKPKASNSSSLQAVNSLEEEQALYLIPLQSTINNNVKGYITAYKHNNTTYTYRVYNKDSLSEVTSADNQAKTKLLNTQAIIAYFEKQLNNKNEIQVTGSVHGVMKNPTLNFSVAPLIGSNNNYSSTEGTTIQVVIEITYEWHDYTWGDGEWVAVYTTITIIISTNPEDPGGISGGPVTPELPEIPSNPTNNPWEYGTGWPWGNGNPEWNWWWTSGGGSGTSGTTLADWVINQLGIVDWSVSFWLQTNPTRSDEIYNYLNNSNVANKNEIALSHIQTMISDPDYLLFVNDYANNNPNQGMWWENGAWLSDPNNFSIDIDYNGAELKGTNAAERQFIYYHPMEALSINKNADKAILRAQARYPSGYPYFLNDKSDAFRHAYWMALNERDCGVDGNGVSLAYQFGVAHESETPTPLLLEKQMDLHNNNWGIDVIYSHPLLYDDIDIENQVVVYLQNGILKYLKPLDFVNSPRYDVNVDGIPDCSTCLDGMTPGVTSLIPTNQ